MIDIKVPPLGDSITEATVSRWTKNEGESVAAGETIVYKPSASTDDEVCLSLDEDANGLVHAWIVIIHSNGQRSRWIAVGRTKTAVTSAAVLAAVRRGAREPYAWSGSLGMQSSNDEDE